MDKRLEIDANNISRTVESLLGEIEDLENIISIREREIRELQDKVTELEEENEELQHKLDNVQ